MILQKDEFRIESDGIWISKKALKEWADHYNKVSLGFDRKGNILPAWLYMGKTDVCIDLLKHFEPLEP